MVELAIVIRVIEAKAVLVAVKAVKVAELEVDKVVKGEDKAAKAVLVEEKVVKEKVEEEKVVAVDLIAWVYIDVILNVGMQNYIICICNTVLIVAFNCLPSWMN